MILNRVGNKRAIASEIIKHFPPHTLFIDMFFGAGGLLKNKPPARFNICNDIDNDVFNFWKVIQDSKDEFLKQANAIPVHESIFKHYIKNTEQDPIKQAVRFFLLSNFSYMGKSDTLRLGYGNPKEVLNDRIEKTFNFLKDVQFLCADFRNVIKKIEKPADGELQNRFIYADPPYLSTINNYKDGFKERDTVDLFDTLIGGGSKFAVSEFNNPFILDLAKELKLEIIEIGERLNMKNRRTEVLVVNYQSPALYSLFSDVDLKQILF